jgi:hypothetical protein
MTSRHALVFVDDVAARADPVDDVAARADPVDDVAARAGHAGNVRQHAGSFNSGRRGTPLPPSGFGIGHPDRLSRPYSRNLTR